MLRELKNVRQIDGDRRRRWFADDELELILWYDTESRLDGFQICYDKLAGTRMITWKRVQTPEGVHKSVLLADRPRDRERIVSLLSTRSENLDNHLRQFILDRLDSNGG